MNTQMIRYTLARIMMIEGGLMVLPAIVALIYREGLPYILSYVSVAALLILFGLVTTKDAPIETTFGAREGFVIVALTWILMSLFGALPLLMTKQIPTLVDAYFEISSGLTTTGASVISDVESLTHSTLFWRSFTHFIGGMGILVFVLAVLPKSSQSALHIMKAEVPGPVFGKLTPKLRLSAKLLYLIYTLMTITLILLLWLGEMNLFDAIIHAFGTAGTGGFSSKNNSIAYFSQPYTQYVLALGMIFYGINFNLYYYLVIRRFKQVWKSEELRYYLGIICAAVLLIAVSLRNSYTSFEKLFRESFFTVASIISTTGYSNLNYDWWPLLPHYILLLLMFCGACAGSTAGGIKVSRIMILLKSVYREMKTIISPNRKIAIKVDKKPIAPSVVAAVTGYLFIYMTVFLLILLLITIETKDFTTAFSAVAATFNNIGPGLGVVGPAGNYAGFSDYSKIILSIAMIAGRLEILPLLVLFSPSVWNKRIYS